jgi:hypothetical protein
MSKNNRFYSDDDIGIFNLSDVVAISSIYGDDTSYLSFNVHLKGSVILTYNISKPKNDLSGPLDYSKVHRKRENLIERWVEFITGEA